MLRFALLLRRPARWWWLTLASVPVACNALWGIDELSYDQAPGGATSIGGQAAGGSTATGGIGGVGGAAGAPAGGAGGQGGAPCKLGPFGEPVVLTEVNSEDGDWDPALSPDERTIYFVSDRLGGSGEEDLWVATRSDAQAPFGVPVSLAAVNSVDTEVDPEISTDGLTLYLAANRPAPGDLDIWFTTRPSVAAVFGALQNLGGVNTVYEDRDPSLSPDGRIIVFASDRPGGAGDHDLWVATRPTDSVDFDPPVNLATVNSAVEDSNPAISSNGLELYCSRGSNADSEIWLATRPDVGSALGPPEVVPELNTGSGNSDPFLSADRRTIYFSSTRTGGQGSGDIWVATRSCE